MPNIQNDSGMVPTKRFNVQIVKTRFAGIKQVSNKLFLIRATRLFFLMHESKGYIQQTKKLRLIKDQPP